MTSKLAVSCSSDGILVGITVFIVSLAGRNFKHTPPRIGMLLPNQIGNKEAILATSLQCTFPFIISWHSLQYKLIITTGFTDVKVHAVS